MYPGVCIQWCTCLPTYPGCTVVYMPPYVPGCTMVGVYPPYVPGVPWWVCLYVPGCTMVGMPSYVPGYHGEESLPTSLRTTGTGGREPPSLPKDHGILLGREPLSLPETVRSCWEESLPPPPVSLLVFVFPPLCGGFKAGLGWVYTSGCLFPFHWLSRIILPFPPVLHLLVRKHEVRRPCVEDLREE